MAFVATIEDGQPKLRGVLSTGATAESFLERIKSDYLYRSQINALLRQRRLGSRADVPVGAAVTPRNIRKPPSPVLPALATRSTGISTAAVYGLPGASGGVSTSQDQAQLPTQQTSKEQAMDLGSIITTLGGQYIQARFGQPAAPTIYSASGMPRPIMATPVSDVYGVQPALLQGLPALAGPAVRFGGSMADKIAGAVAGLGIGLSADEIAAVAGVASKVKCRRKRRRLATHSDIKDLAALKAVLGSGKAFDTWIATRRV